ncbi:MAG: RNA methyltransferase [Candidatus Paceibacterota bacterium]
MAKQELYLILDNIRSALNVGAIFRTADAAGVDKILLCGYTPTPENDKVKKTALGSEKTVTWEHHPQTWRLVKRLRKGGIYIVALEQDKRSTDYRKLKPKFPMALIVGNEVKGLSKNILEHVDKIIDIPMYGQKESLNVAVATGIAVYKIRETF